VPVRKAVIPAAGFGTRFLPASKAVPKVLLPVVDRPAIQYAVEELVRAGVTDICIVTSRGGDAVIDHFGATPDLELALHRGGKHEFLDEVLALRELADIYAVRQHEALGLGHAVWTARSHVGGDPFVVVLPDELFDPRANFLGDMVAAFDEHGESVIAVQEVPHEHIRFYGSIDAIADPDGPEDLVKVRALVEKPDPAKAPSDLAAIGRYVLDPEIFEILEKVDPGAGGEIQLTDGLNVLAERRRLRAKIHRGRRWDVGSKAGYLQATVTLAAEREDLGPDFRRFLERFVG
jgi:UTP--glucose-1-phosphate uridylyltransferase